MPLARHFIAFAAALAALSAGPLEAARAAPEEPPKSGASMPRPTNYAPPRYPPEAEAAGLEAVVVLELDIDKTGRVTRAAVLEPGGHGFDEAALEAARDLVFEPARWADGTPFSARIRYRYTFTLKPQAPAGAAPGSSTPQEEPERAEPLQGVVLTAGDEAPIAGASVTATDEAGRERSVTAGGDGQFRFPDLAPGRYRVSVRQPGFDSLEVEEEIAADEALVVKYRLAPSGGGLTVTVRGARPPREVSRRTLDRREMSRIPGTNGDALRSIQSLPGVARPPGLAGLLIVRGSAPQDTQAFVDGTPVPLIYHFGGLSSAIPTELLERIDFYPGNFSAQYGRVMGGIVDAAIRPVRDDGRYHGLAQVDLIDARAMIEGPLVPGVRFVAAGRRSHLDTWLGPVLTGLGVGVTQAPVYYDYQFAIEADPTPRSSFRVAFFGSDDALALVVNDPSPDEPGLSGSLGFHTAFQRLQLRLLASSGQADKVSATVAFGRDNVDFNIGAIYFYLDTSTINSRLEVARRMSSGVTLNAGADLLFGAFKVAFRGPSAPRPGEPANQPYSTRVLRDGAFSGSLLYPAAYAELELSPTAGVKIVPGARIEGHNITDGVDVSPRLSARWDILKEPLRTTVKGGLGMFTQTPQLFESVPPLGTPGVKTARAIHYALGAEQEVTRELEVSAEGFFKQFDRLVVGTPASSGGSFEYKNLGMGYATGLEVLLKHKATSRLFGWVAYTLSRSVRKDGPGEPERLFESDQTHLLTVLGSYRLGGGWEVGARFRLASGDLTTPQVCSPGSEGCDPSKANALFHSPTGGYTPLPSSGAYSERLPPFHQLDLRVDKRWSMGDYELSAYLDVQNVYNNANPEGIDYNFNFTTRQYESGLPILPSIGLRGEF
jgi:TonB family protein